MKLANPLYYPLAVLVGAGVLVVGVRVAGLPSAVMVPVAVVVATGGAILRKGPVPESLGLGDPELERQLLVVHQQARNLANKTSLFRLEATRLLTDAAQMDLLVAIQYSCDRAGELPDKIDQLTRRLQGSDSLLSANELKQQLSEVESRLSNSFGIAHEQLVRLAERLQQNLQLVQQGQDVRQAQVSNLAMLVTDTAGVLQELQNKLRTANFADTSQTLELRSLSDELSGFQENVDLLVSR